ncbi:MAG: ABC transporter ATP-binding protein, partial [Chloroflexota bacterium]
MMNFIEDTILSVRELSIIFSDDNGNLDTLDRVTFTVQAQHFICILGPSGCGKTTLLRVLGGFLFPTSGEVCFKNQPLSGPRREIGFVFQGANLMPWRTVIQNITLPLELSGISKPEAEKQAKELIELVGLQGFEEYLPRDLSGGMAQRVAIARVLIYDPDVLLLDEPFGALDAITRQRMCIELLRIWQARCKTMVMVTHSISDAVFLADKVLVLSPRPGHICLDLTIDLPRPRMDEMRYTSEFTVLAHRLRDAIG